VWGKRELLGAVLVLHGLWSTTHVLPLLLKAALSARPLSLAIKKLAGASSPRYPRKRTTSLKASCPTKTSIQLFALNTLPQPTMEKIQCLQTRLLQLL